MAPKHNQGGMNRILWGLESTPTSHSLSWEGESPPSGTAARMSQQPGRNSARSWLHSFYCPSPGSTPYFCGTPSGICPAVPIRVLSEHPILFAIVKRLIILVLIHPFPCRSYSARSGVKFSQGIVQIYKLGISELADQRPRWVSSVPLKGMGSDG